MQNLSLKNLLIMILIAGALAIYFGGLFIDVARDGGKYAAIAKEIVLTGDYINLKIHGEAYNQKPPFMFWLSALSFLAFGFSNFSFKLPLLLYSLSGVYFTYRLGKSIFNHTIGLLSAFCLAFSEYFILYVMDIHTDTALLPSVALANWQLVEFVRHRKMKNLIGGFVGIGLAMLTKGPIGAVIPAFTIGGHLLLSGKIKQIFDWRWLVGVAVSGIIIIPALAGLYGQFGLKGIGFFFWTNNIGRLTGSYMGTNHDYTFFVHTILYMLLPWSVFFYNAAFIDIRRIVRKHFRSFEFYTTSGIWVFFLLMSFSRSKLPNYIYALAPMMCVLTAKWIYYSYLTSTPKLRKYLTSVEQITSILLWILLIIVATYIFPVKNPIPWIITGALFILFLTTWRNKKLTYQPVFLAAIAMTALSLTLNYRVFPDVFSQQAPPEAARLYNSMAKPDEKLYNYKYGHFELFFYGKGLVPNIGNIDELKKTLTDGHAWIFTDRWGYADIQEQKPHIDTIFVIKHANLKKGARLLNPQTREQSKENMYLFRIR